MHPLTQTVCDSLKTAGAGDTPLLVALSGGADSVALLRACHECRSLLRLQIHAAHLNHRLRGSAADADAAWVQALCQQLEIPLDHAALDIRDLAAQTQRGIEETARDARYRFLEQTAQSRGCPVVAVAHTASDQAETVLHNLLRGTGIAGLRGIPGERSLSEGVRILRPLLGVSRCDVERFLQDLGQDYRHDETNSDPEYTRNRLRHRLLPQLRDEFNPRVEQCLLSLAQQADELAAALEYAADALLTEAGGRAGPEKTVVKLRWKRLIGPPRHLLRTVFVQLWKHQQWPRQEMTFVHWQRLADLVELGGREQFPGGIDAERVEQFLILRAAPRQYD